MRRALPLANPVCTHEWVAVPTASVWRCEVCGYEVSEQERHEPKEGEWSAVLTLLVSRE